MSITLVVVRPFGPHATGDCISAPDVVAAILGSDHANAVVAVPNSATDVVPDPAPDPVPDLNKEH